MFNQKDGKGVNPMIPTVPDPGVSPIASTIPRSNRTFREATCGMQVSNAGFTCVL